MVLIEEQRTISYLRRQIKMFEALHKSFSYLSYEQSQSSLNTLGFGHNSCRLPWHVANTIPSLNFSDRSKIVKHYGGGRISLLTCPRPMSGCTFTFSQLEIHITLSNHFTSVQEKR